jgi:hypothetical protein
MKMLIAETTVKNKKRRHIRAWNENNGIEVWDDYIYHDDLEDKLIEWIDEYETIIVTNDIDVIKILKEKGYNYYDID